MRIAKRGFTLIEALVGMALLLGAGTALLLSFLAAVAHAEYVSRLQTAVNAAQGQLEALMAESVTTIASDAQFAPARGSGQCVGIVEDPNCALGTAARSGRLAVQIKNPDGSLATSASDMVDVHVAACWVIRGRIIGEDVNCNGHLDAGEDLNGNGWIDSPAMVTTRIARKE